MSKIKDYKEYIKNTTIGSIIEMIEGNPNTIYDEIVVHCSTCNKNYNTTPSAVKRRNICFCFDTKEKRLERFKKELLDAGINKIIVDATYSTISKKATFICPDHGEYKATPQDVLRLDSHGCKGCRNMGSPSLSHDEYLKILLKKGHDLSLFDYVKKYETAHTDLIVRCNTCHKNFYSSPSNHTKFYSCPHCNNKYNKILGSYEDYAYSRIKSVHGEKYIINKEDIRNGSDKIPVICNKHGEFYISLSQLFNGQGCKPCGRLQANKKTSLKKSEVKKRLKNIYGDALEFSGIENYKNINTKITAYCLIHEKHIKKPVGQFFEGKGCQLCGRERIRKAKLMTTDEFREKAKLKHDYRYEYPYEIQGNNKTRVKILCKDHGVFEQRINDHLNGAGCPSCAYGTTKAVLEITEALDEKKINYKLNDRIVLNGLELDIYFPDHNFAIEYNGLYYHNEGHNHNTGGKDKKYHLQKTEICNENGIELYHIFEDEYLNNSEVIIKRIFHKLGINDSKIIGARKTVIKEIDYKECRDFLNKWHLQGQDTSGVRYGAFYKNELVGVMTFYISKNEGKLNRFATNLNYKIPGLASKFVKYFIKNNKKIENITTFADRRYTNFPENSVYHKMGFDFVHYTKPAYFYYKSGLGTQRFSRQKFMKHKILKEHPQYKGSGLGEKEMMIDLGYDRIWDCGHIKFNLKVCR